MTPYQVPSHLPLLSIRRPAGTYTLIARRLLLCCEAGGDACKLHLLINTPLSEAPSVSNTPTPSLVSPEKS